MNERDANLIEGIGELLGEPPMPPGWYLPLQIEAQAIHLSVLADGAADAALALVLHYAEHGSAPPIEDPRVDAFADRVFELDAGWRRYVCYTQKGDGAEIIYVTIARKLGATGAEWITAAIDRLRERRTQRVAVIVAKQGLRNLEHPAPSGEQEI